MRRNTLLPLAGALAIAALMLVPASALACAPHYCPSDTLRIAEAGSGSGTVSVSPAGVNCSSSFCSYSFEEDTRITLTATPAAGSIFAGWSGGGCSGTGRCVLTIKGATTVTATFIRNSPPPPCEKIALGRVKRRGAALVLRVAVPCPGKLVARGKRLRTVRKSVGVPGTLAVKLRLKAAALAALEASKTGKLKLKIVVTFTPTGGTPVSVRKRVILRS